jgi:hypothetical protein
MLMTMSVFQEPLDASDDYLAFQTLRPGDLVCVMPAGAEAGPVHAQALPASAERVVAGSKQAEKPPLSRDTDMSCRGEGERQASPPHRPSSRTPQWQQDMGATEAPGHALQKALKSGRPLCYCGLEAAFARAGLETCRQTQGSLPQGATKLNTIALQQGAEWHIDAPQLHRCCPYFCK